MFLVRKYKSLAVLATLWLITPIGCIGCIVKSQQAVPEALPASRAVALEPSPLPSPITLRGLQDVIPGSSTIVPAEGVGPLRLGDNRERAVELFGAPNEEYAFDESSLGPCKYTEIHWNDPKHDDRWGIFVYLQNNRIYQIMVDTPRYATAGGITSDSTPEEVRRLFPTLRSYELLGSDSRINGGENLVYWVDQSAGIAFEFYHHPKLNKRRLARTIVLTPDVQFLPTGCISPPQQWQKLSPFSFRSPASSSSSAKFAPKYK